MFPALLTAICFAGAAVSARQSATLNGPFRANLLRLLIAVLILGSIAAIFRQELPGIILLKFFIAGGIGFGLGGFCMMQTLRRLGSPKSLLTVEGLTAVFAGFLAWLFLDESMRLIQLAACAIILGGVLLAGSIWFSDAAQKESRPGGYALAVGAALFQAISLVISRQAFLEAAAESIQVGKFNAAFVRLLGGLLVAGFLWGFAWCNRKGRQPPPSRLFVRTASLRQQPLLWATLNALAGPVLGVTCWLWAVSLMNPGIVQSIAATSPLISIPLSKRLEWNRLGIRFFAGSLTAIAGIAILVLC